MSVSKSFRAVLPPLREDELVRLRAWSEENCATAAVFREGDTVIWLASKERARSREAFMRSARNTLKRLAVDVVANLKAGGLPALPDVLLAPSDLRASGVRRESGVHIRNG